MRDVPFRTPLFEGEDPRLRPLTAVWIRFFRNLASAVDGATSTTHGFGATISVDDPTFYFPAAAFAGTIIGWKIVSPLGAAATVEFWKVAAGVAIPTSGDSINTAGVSIGTAEAISSTDLTDFTDTAIALGDLLAVTLTAGDGPVTVELDYR